MRPPSPKCGPATSSPPGLGVRPKAIRVALLVAVAIEQRLRQCRVVADRAAVSRIVTQHIGRQRRLGADREAFLEQARALGVVRYLFANTGTDHGPIIEALAKTAREDPTDIQPIVVPHEMAAVSMAHGYYNVTQKPQMVLVHTLPGTANALGGILNAQSSNVPVVLVAGRTPITEGEVRGGKSQHIHWRQESRDQGAIVREFVKWDYELRTNQNIPTVVQRAFNIAMSEPRGPVYLTLPREWLCEELESTRLAGPITPATKM